ncbi:unnamed protein product [Cuscuta campestris]|uniref:Mechanosensitive ion channel protein n=1 Tax=Cuscuta campestris TaxID=132261 RepID=A0A484K7T8_9ASTE|nr:unnamed protein product [Cuscuta campestris]
MKGKGFKASSALVHDNDVHALGPPSAAGDDVGHEFEEDDEDPFLEDDLPEDYNNKIKCSPLTIMQLVSFALIVTSLCCILAIPVLRKISIGGLELWKWVLMALLLICGRIISGGVIRVAIVFMESTFILRKRVLYFVYSLRSSVQNCVWLGLVLISWLCIFGTRLKKVAEGAILPQVTRLLICLFVGTLIRLAKTVAIKVLAMSFHVPAYFDRIQGSLFNQYVIQTLCGGPPLMGNVRELEKENKSHTSMFSRIIMSKKGKVEERRISPDYLSRLTEKNISAWNMKRLMGIVRKGMLWTLDEQMNECRGRDESAVQITSERQGNVAAKKIFHNVAKPGSVYIYKEDLLCFMREDEALKVLHLIEGGSDDETKGISKGALKNWVKAFREQRFLALSQKDTKTAVNKLHHMLNFFVAGLVAVIWLLILQVTTVKFFIALCSQIVVVAFVFGDTAKRAFEAIVFLFIMHPFDVGDCVLMDGVWVNKIKFS